MRTFLLKLAVFGAIQAVIVIAFEVGLARVPTTYSAIRQELEAHAAQCTILLTGSSQTQVGVHARDISDEAINISNFSQDIYYSTRVASLYLGRLPRLRVVFVELSYFTLRYDILQSPEYWRAFFYGNAYGIPVRDPSYRLDPRAWSLLALYGGMPSLRLALSGFSTSAVMETAGPQAPTAFSAEGGRARVKFHHAMMKPATAAANIAMLRDLFSRLGARGIQWVMFSPPTTRAYRAAMDPDVWRETQLVAAGLALAYHGRYLDFSDDEAFQQEDFTDYDHLNAAGAQKFSARVREVALHSQASPPAP